jgi:hypothetical protein
MLYQPADVGELAAAMRRMRDSQLRDRLSAKARDALGPYSPEVVAAELQGLYDRVSSRSQPRL